MEFLRELFTNYQSADSFYILTWLIGSFLIGWLMNYFMGRRKISLLAASVEKSTLELNQSKKQQETLQGQYDLKEADYKKSSLALLDKNKLVSSLESDKRGMNTRLKTTLDEYEKAKVEHTQTATRLEELNEQILGLRTKNAQLNAEIQQSTQTINQYAATQTSQEDQQELATIIARLRDQNSQLQKTNTSLQKAAVTDKTSIEQYEALELKLAKAEAETEELKAANITLQEATPISNISTESYETLQLQVEQLEAEKEQLSEALAEITQLENGNESLTSTVSNLMSENEALKEQLDQLPQLEDGNATLKDSMTQLIDQNESLKAKIEELQQYESGNEVLHSTIAKLTEQNELLQQKSTALGIASSAETPIVTAIPTVTAAIDELDTEQAKVEIRAAIGNQIKETSSKDKDDLQQINGIGPFIEEKLNDLGIYSFGQVAQLDDRLINVLTAAIEFFPGRIERDEWVGQADRLSFMKKSVASSPRRSLTSKTVVTKPTSEPFLSEKKAIQEKIIVEDSTAPAVDPTKITRVIRREPIRRVVRRGPMPTSTNKVTDASSSSTFKEAITEKLIVPPAMPAPPVVVPDTSLDQDAKEAEMLIEAHIAREKVAERAAKKATIEQKAIVAKAVQTEQVVQATKETAAKKAQAEKEAAQAKAIQVAKEAQLAREATAKKAQVAKEAELARATKAAKEAQLVREKAAKEAAAAKAAEQAKAAQAARETELRVAKEAQAAKEAAAKKAQAEKEAAEAKAKREAELKAAKEAQAAKKAAAEKEAAARAAQIQSTKEAQAAKDMIAARRPASPDDLKQIEGIGPKIATLLANAGIINFEQLATKSVDQLQDILDEAGPRYRIAKPRTWPTQARMAASGDWDSLKDFQDRLRGGKLID